VRAARSTTTTTSIGSDGFFCWLPAGPKRAASACPTRDQTTWRCHQRFNRSGSHARPSNYGEFTTLGSNDCHRKVYLGLLLGRRRAELAVESRLAPNSWGNCRHVRPLKSFSGLESLPANLANSAPFLTDSTLGEVWQVIRCGIVPPPAFEPRPAW
jgi:hypothetical protein